MKARSSTRITRTRIRARIKIRIEIKAWTRTRIESSVELSELCRAP